MCYGAYTMVTATPLAADRVEVVLSPRTSRGQVIGVASAPIG
jgi:hypothetical protein